MRGFEIVTGYENKVFGLPQRSTKHSAGYDICLCEDLEIEGKSFGIGITGIKAYMEQDEVLQLVPRSSLPKRHSLILPNSIGIIDADYYNNEENEGHIYIQLYNLSNKKVFVPKGAKLVQAIFIKYYTSEKEQKPTIDRSGGFGSTDK